MSGFKLIAIVPLKDCNTKFRKNLKIGNPYKFYSYYKIRLNKDNSEIISIDYDKEDFPPENLYLLKNGIKLNISAIVGKNGTGKSTIIELLYYFIYILGVKKKSINSVLIDLENEHKTISDDYNRLRISIDIQSKLEKKVDLSDEEKSFKGDDYKDLHHLCFELVKKYNLINFKGNLKNINGIPELIKEELFHKVIKIHNLCEDERKSVEPLLNDTLNLSVIYETDKIINELKLYKDEITLIKHFPNHKKEIFGIEDFDFKDFFYSISLNYSHHGLNSKIIGNWITKLFHKNDAYTTPVVINPMRDDGNFDINHEMRLSKERLMSNIIFDLVNNKSTLLLGKYRISKFIFSPKVLSPPFPLHFDEKFIDQLNCSYIFKKILKIEKLDDNIAYWDFAISYLEKKILKIDKNYNELIHSNSGLFNYESELAEFISSDATHITKKVRQVINFLKATYIKKNRDFWQIPKQTVRIELTPNKMLEWLNLQDIELGKTKPSEIIEYALPGFFNIDFELEDITGDNFEFGKLSSGEQQMIFNLNSILYHLYNVQSVHNRGSIIVKKNNNGFKNKRVKYENVNIILDEIELYYHPEMQRFLIKNLVDSFEQIKNKGQKGIGSINVCFLTHSPFILSDIPRQNTLLLGIVKDTLISNFPAEKTFGNNIHDSLIDNFFMSSTIGEYSRLKIDEFAKALNKAYSHRISNKTNLLNSSIKTIENLGGKKFIELIGDSLVRDKLYQLYFIVTEENHKEGIRKYYEKKIIDLSN